jgi:hypothetical protein
MTQQTAAMSAPSAGSVPWCKEYDAATLSTGVEALAEAMHRIGNLNENLFGSVMAYAFFLGRGQDPLLVTEIPDELELFLKETLKAKKECFLSHMLVRLMTTIAGQEGQTLFKPGARGIELVATDLQADGQRPRSIG